MQWFHAQPGVSQFNKGAAFKDRPLNPFNAKIAWKTANIKNFDFYPSTIEFIAICNNSTFNLHSIAAIRSDFPKTGNNVTNNHENIYRVETYFRWRRGYRILRLFHIKSVFICKVFRRGNFKWNSIVVTI